MIEEIDPSHRDAALKWLEQNRKKILGVPLPHPDEYSGNREGMIRFNADLNLFQTFINGAWVANGVRVPKEDWSVIGVDIKDAVLE